MLGRRGYKAVGESKDGKKRQGDFAQRLEELRRKNDEREERIRNTTSRHRMMLRVMGARTLEEIAEVREVMMEWLEEHPEDSHVLGRLGGDMGTMEAFIEHDNAREELVERAKRARSLEEIAENRRAIGEWLERFPQDASAFASANEAMKEWESVPNRG